MKSTVVKMYDYKSWEIPAEITLWRIADGEIEQQLERLSHDHAYEMDADTVELLDSVACRGECESSRWNRAVLLIYPGRKLCAGEIETALIGAKVGESRTVATPDGDVKLTVTRIVRRRNLPIGDKLVKAIGIENVETVEDYYRWYRDQNEPERRANAAMRIAYQMIKQIVEKSEFCFDENEKRDWLNDRVERYYRALVLAGIDPTIPQEGTVFLTEEQAKAKMYAGFEPQFSIYVVCGHLVETLTGVAAETFCEEAIEELATDNNMPVEELVERSGKYACYDKLLQDKALALLATYTEQFLED